MKKLSLLLCSLFFTVFVHWNTANAVEGCCSHHGGVAGFVCEDGTPIPVSSPSCINAPRDYYQNLLSKCYENQRIYEKNEVSKGRDLSIARDTYNNRSNSGLIEYYKQQYEEAQALTTQNALRCEAINEEYEQGRIALNDYLKSGGCGENSYFSSEEKCSCYEGYERVYEGNSDCVSMIISTCGINSYVSDNGACKCDEGYIWQNENENDLNCIEKIVCEENAHKSNIYNSCLCNEGYKEKAGTIAEGENCVPVRESCGESAHITNAGKDCICQDGYEWGDYTKINCVSIGGHEEEEDNTEEPQPAFTDLPTTHKNKTAIEYLKEKNIIGGYKDGTFQPEKAINRAELLKVLIESRVSGFKASEHDISCFIDTPQGAWFTPYICYSQKQGWTNGYKDNTFRPAQTVSKAEALKIILSAFQFSMPSEAQISYFDDVSTQEWFSPYIQTAKEHDFLEEVSGKYSPHEGMTRASVSEVIYRAMKFLSEPTI